MTNTDNNYCAGKDAIVLGITRMTIHNGPGYRTLVLFKGCPLRCKWCSTPESQSDKPQLGFYPDKCINCGNCLDICPVTAISMGNGHIEVNREICNDCGKCPSVCHSGALGMHGQTMGVEELIKEINKDSVLFKHSGGGVTLSGGEPLYNFDYLMKLLKGLKEKNISVGIDTTGFISREKFEEVLPLVDFLLLDIKHMDTRRHRELTGVDNVIILNNIMHASDQGVPIYIRYPIIPGMNDSVNNLRNVCKFVAGLKSVVEVDLLPIHHLGRARYASLGWPYPLEGVDLIPDETMRYMQEIVESYGLKCVIGG
jgi:pyruvate formate lyase activating enzyme